MKDKIAKHIDGLFKNASPTEKILDLKEEILQNLEDKYDDLIAEGKMQDEAYNIVIEGIGDVPALLKELEDEVPPKASKHKHKRKHSGHRTSIFQVFGMDSFEADTSYRIPVSQIDSIDIDWISGAISIESDDECDDILLTEFSRHELRENEHLLFKIEGSTLFIKFSERRAMQGFIHLSKELEVQIPYALSRTLKSVKVNSVSGGIEIDDIQAEEVDLKTVSGRVEMSEVMARTVGASTTSGRIELDDLHAEKVLLKTVSGRIVIDDGKAQDLQTSTVSGRHELLGGFRNVKANSASGRIEVESYIVPKRLEANTMSGRISVAVPSEGPISVSHSSVMGKLMSEIPIVTGVQDAQFKLSTTSGRIEILKS